MIFWNFSVVLVLGSNCSSILWFFDCFNCGYGYFSNIFTFFSQNLWNEMLTWVLEMRRTHFTTWDGNESSTTRLPLALFRVLCMQSTVTKGGTIHNSRWSTNLSCGSWKGIVSCAAIWRRWLDYRWRVSTTRWTKVIFFLF